MRRQPAWALVPVSIAVAASLFLAARVQAPTPRETPVPSASSVGVPGVLGRPYLPESAWNTPIPDSPLVDPRSDVLLGSIGESGNDGVITSDPTQFTYPVYEVGADTPGHDLRCKWFKCTVVGDDGNSERVEVLEDVPIPDWARPSEGSDSSMIIIDVESGTEWDLWKVERQGDGTWSVANGSVYNVGWDGMPEEYGSRGAGLPYLAGLVRHREVVAGEIEHAIAFAYPHVAKDFCVWPASKTDGQSDAPNALPEGARLQLDPELTDPELRRMGLDETGLIIARALQRYSMIVVDVSRRPKIMVEDLTANERAEGSWRDDSETPLHEDAIAAIPFTSFRVLALPSADLPQAEEQLHGNCYR
ncbi:MAG: hypothetical protein ABR593_10215 [Candidatus Limnocylindria bacterium]